MGIVSMDIDPQYVEDVIALVTGNPTASSLDELIEAYATLGFYEAQLSQRADEIEAIRKNKEANIILEKKSEAKYTAAELESYANVGSFDIRRKEIQARGDWRKISNLRYSVEQAINGVKFLGKLA